ncbi:uncharacterized protein C8Q71DRAFT_595497 [Rhodofomes roseus]|uniref:Uncharacterized protein n=1 Tax=Rhodofomes roseus TaxID=34475 RepID=A0ABQ8KI28_9APHY|nr:uncharacterized protein C8Q71DRAFT_595497 [Rhodofomes roseus]KAH9837304.1 hypothetical protein C8Q71DRAFT_595497 [Rhodofomes roseus]
MIVKRAHILMFAYLLGILSGLYIFKPLLESQPSPPEESVSRVVMDMRIIDKHPSFTGQLSGGKVQLQIVMLHCLSQTVLPQLLALATQQAER